jgi:hypothetical protein
MFLPSRRVLTLAVGALGVFCAVITAVGIATHDVTALGLILVPVGIGVVWAFWRQAVYLLLLLVFLEGIVRIALSQPAVLLVKDAVVAVLIVRVLYERHRAGRRLIKDHPVNIPLAVLVAICLAEIANPAQSSVLVGVIGLRTWLFYAALLYVGAEAIRSEQELARLVDFYVFAAIPLCAFGFAQLLLGPAAYSHLGAAFGPAAFVTSTGTNFVQVYRPNSTFAWPSHFAVFLGSATLLSAARLAHARGRLRLVFAVVFVGLIAADVMENQRTTLVLLPLLLAAVFAAGRRRFLMTVGVVLAAAALGLAILPMFASGSSGAVQRVLDIVADPGGQIGPHADSYIGQTLTTLGQAPFGFGTGATSIGSRYVAGNVPIFVESSLAKAAGDLGLPGLLAYIGMFVVLVRTSLTLARRDDGARGRIAAAVMGTQLILFLGGYDLAIAAVTLWLFSGAIGTVPATQARATEGAPLRPSLERTPA